MIRHEIEHTARLGLSEIRITAQLGTYKVETQSDGGKRSLRGTWKSESCVIEVPSDQEHFECLIGFRWT